jgi:hypothetical protein
MASTSMQVATSLSVPLSDGERQFIVAGVAQDVRCDGRGSHDSRTCKIETDVIATASGSAQVTIEGTQVLATIKAQVLTITAEDQVRDPSLESLLTHDCSVSLSSGVQLLASMEAADGIKAMLELQVSVCVCASFFYSYIYIYILARGGAA